MLALTRIEFPDRWLQGVRRWTEWAAFTRRRKTVSDPLELAELAAVDTSADPAAQQLAASTDTPTAPVDTLGGAGFGRTTSVSRVPLRLR